MIEPLESRRLLSVLLRHGVLTIQGTPGDDQLLIEDQTPSIVTFQAKRSRLYRVANPQPPLPTLVVTLNGQTTTFANKRISRIVIDTGLGNDSIRLAPLPPPPTPSWIPVTINLNGPHAVSLPAFIDAGPGDDTLVSGNGNDTLLAGPGDDSIDAAGGNDFVFGDTGRDTLIGGLGGDTLLGARGDDDLSGGFGEDLLVGGAGSDALDGGYGRDSAHGGPGFDYASDCSNATSSATPADSTDPRLFIHRSSLESTTRVINTDAHTSLIDAGDYYWYLDQQIPLYRATDEVLVGLKSSADRETLIAQLTSATGPLHGFTYTEMAPTLLRFQRDLPLAARFDAVLTRVKSFDGVAYVSLAFINKDGDWHSWPANELIVSLKPNVDPASIFGSEFEYRPWFDGYLATLKTGGGLDVLAAANRLHSNPDVLWADVNFYGEGRFG